MSPIVSRVAFNRGFGFGSAPIRTITITSQPAAVTSYVGLTATFTISATVTGNQSISYQWQRSDDSGSTWNNVGTNSNSYTTPSLVVASDNNDMYRCILSSPRSFSVTSNSATLTVLDFDFTVTPAVSGVTYWSISRNGTLILDGGTSTTYTLVASKNLSRTTKMWGQGGQSSEGGTGGYSTGTVNFTSGSTYSIRLNTGGGNGGTGAGSCGSRYGGGYAGIFNGTSITQGSAIMIAGGGGGGASSCGGSGTAAGGGGGGSSGGGGGNSPDSQRGSTGGGGGTQSAGGAAGNSPGGGSTAGSALQGGQGGIGAGAAPNYPGGGGGGGGYFGGGGGGGGNDDNAGTRSASGGGAGSGYINASFVTGGSTSGFANASDPNRGSAGNASSNSRIVIE